MGRVRHDDLLTRQIATRTVIVVDGHQTRQFSMGTGIGLKGEMSQTREGTERLFQEGNQCLGTLYGCSRLPGMQVLKLWHSSYLFVYLGIVLHCTRSQWIEACIYTEVIIRQIGIMTHHCQFIALRQSSIFCTFHRSWYLVTAIVVLWQTITLATLLREFKD